MTGYMEDLRRESSAAKEKYGKFYAEKRINYVGYFVDGEFTVEKIKQEESSTVC